MFTLHSTLPVTVEEEEVESQKKKSRVDETGEIDLMSILGADTAKIGTVNPVNDFSFLLEIGKKPIEKLYEEMEQIIVELMQDSGGTNIPLMIKAQSCLQAFRKHAVVESRTTDFNRWMERFKEQVVGNYFTDFWQKYVAEARLGLITKEESSVSNVDKQEAEKFLNISTLDEALFDSDDDEALVSYLFRYCKIIFIACFPCEDYFKNDEEQIVFLTVVGVVIISRCQLLT